MSRGTINKAIIIGRLGKDPDMRYTPGGTAVANFSAATNHGTKDADGNWTDQTEWHNIVTFGRQAEFAGEYLKKGKLVFIEGRLQTRSWEDQNGNKHYKTEIVGSNIQLLGSKGDAGATDTVDAPKPEQTQTAPPQEEPSDPQSEEDDLPF